MFSPETKMDKMDADLAMFRRAFNQRVLYFRQLQEISDSVAEVEYEGTQELALDETRKEAADLEDKVKTNHARQRYLENLASREEDDDEDQDCCILCRCEFERGFITAWYVGILHAHQHSIDGLSQCARLLRRLHESVDHEEGGKILSCLSVSTVSCNSSRPPIDLI